MGTISICLWGLVTVIKIGVLATQANRLPPKLPEMFQNKTLLRSPVDIVTENSKEEKCADLKMETVLKKGDKCVTMKNTGKEVELGIQKCINRPILTGGPLDYYDKSVFVFDRLHYHWGPGLKGSEHTINGKMYAMEGHLVFINKKYYPPNADKGVEKINYDGIAVIAFFVEVQDEKNNDAQTMIDQLSKIVAADTHVEITVYDAFQWISSILTLSNYYSYPGSLTNEECNACVTWIVFPKTVRLSRDQIGAFRKLQSKADSRGNTYNITSNFAHPQEMNDRPLLHCK